MSELIDKYFKVMGGGFIALKEVMGSDETIEQAARVSYGKGTRKVSDTRNLIRYLVRNQHSSPIEMAECKLHVRVSMDTWRQWIRHRTANVNEYSTRYSEAIDSRQITLPNDWRLQSVNNKQGSSGILEDWPEGYKVVDQHGGEFQQVITPEFNVDDSKTQHYFGYNENEEIITPGQYLTYREKEFHQAAQNLYQERLQFGIAREVARKDLPLSTYTEAYWKCDLRNILGFLSLRCDSHAQLEIRTYANILAGMIKQLFPLTFEAWYDYQFKAQNFSRMELELLNSGLKNLPETVQGDREFFVQKAAELGMSKREIEEFAGKLEVKPEQNFSLEQYEIYNPPEQS